MFEKDFKRIEKMIKMILVELNKVTYKLPNKNYGPHGAPGKNEPSYGGFSEPLIRARVAKAYEDLVALRQSVGFIEEIYKHIK